MTKPSTLIRLKGIRYHSTRLQSRVWLNNKRLNFERSMSVKAHPPAIEFDWGNSAGAAQLAIAVCAEIYSPDIAKEIYQEFKSRFISPIRSDGFDLVFDLSDFNDTAVERMAVESA